MLFYMGKCAPLSWRFLGKGRGALTRHPDPTPLYPGDASSASLKLVGRLASCTCDPSAPATCPYLAQSFLRGGLRTLVLHTSWSACWASQEPLFHPSHPILIRPLGSSQVELHVNLTTDFNTAAHGCPRLPIAVHGCPWLPMAASGCPWLHMAAPGRPWLPTAAYGCPWLPMAADGGPWLPMAAHGCPWLPMAVHGCPRMPMAAHGNPWLPKPRRKPWAANPTGLDGRAYDEVTISRAPAQNAPHVDDTARRLIDQAQEGRGR